MSLSSKETFDQKKNQTLQGNHEGIWFGPDIGRRPVVPGSYLPSLHRSQSAHQHFFAIALICQPSQASGSCASHG
jgi:hypothetical protein